MEDSGFIGHSIGVFYGRKVAKNLGFYRAYGWVFYRAFRDGRGWPRPGRRLAYLRSTLLGLLNMCWEGFMGPKYSKIIGGFMGACYGRFIWSHSGTRFMGLRVGSGQLRFIRPSGGP